MDTWNAAIQLTDEHGNFLRWHVRPKEAAYLEIEMDFLLSYLQVPSHYRRYFTVCWENRLLDSLNPYRTFEEALQASATRFFQDKA